MAAPGQYGPLQDNALNFSALRERARKELTENLDKMRGSKALVMDKTLSGPLGLIAEKQLIKEHGVEKTYHLKNEPLETDQRRIVYLVTASMSNMKIIADQIRHHQAQRMKMEYYVCLAPAKNIICERVLEDEGVYHDVTLGEYDLGLIPFEDDVLSLEMPDAYRECSLDGDKSALFYAARSLVRLQSHFGLIPVIKGKGTAAKSVADSMLRLRREAGWVDREGEGGIDELILIDRDVDMATPMLSQLTYEGLLDDTFGINNGIVELPSHLISSTQGGLPGGDAKKVKVQFNNNSDQLFSQLRNVNFEQVGPIVKARATYLKSVQDEKDDLQGKSVSEIRDYVKRLKEVNIQQEKNLLSLHTSIALHFKSIVTDSLFSRRLECEQGILQGTMPMDKALDFVEERLCRGEPLHKVLPLLCLCSIVNNGIRKYDFFRELIVQIYGISALLTLSNLESLGILKRYESTATGISQLTSQVSAASISVATAGTLAANFTNKITANSGWDAIRRRLNLVVETAESSAGDIAYAYSGYAPISVRLVEKALQPSGQDWLALEEPLKVLQGPLFQLNQEPRKRPLRTSDIVPPACPISLKPRKVALVFFVGGATYAEVSALRFLSKQNEARGGSRIVVATTKLMNGASLIHTLMDELPNGLRADGSAGFKTTGPPKK